MSAVVKRQLAAERNHCELQTEDNVRKSSSPPSPQLALLGHVCSTFWKTNHSHQGRAQEIVLENVTKQTGDPLSLLVVFLSEVLSYIVLVTETWVFRGEDSKIQNRRTALASLKHRYKTKLMQGPF